MKVHIPSPLLSYTNQQNDVEVSGSTVAEVLDDLNRQFPGIRFRMIDEQDSIRPHMKIFVNGEQVFGLDVALKGADEVYILQALSGG
ncbi:MAG: MoaD/ThiS family protein [Blastocatellales bacterium]